MYVEPDELKDILDYYHEVCYNNIPGDLAVDSNSVIDIIVDTRLTNIPVHVVDHMYDEYPHIYRWSSAIQNRPSLYACTNINIIVCYGCCYGSLKRFFNTELFDFILHCNKSHRVLHYLQHPISQDEITQWNYNLAQFKENL